jgi:hypothetical protein
VITTAGGGDTSHSGGPYERALEHLPTSADSGATGGEPSAESTQIRRIDSPEADPVDLFGVAGAPVTKRLVPIGIAALVLFVLWRLLRGRG